VLARSAVGYVRRHGAAPAALSESVLVLADAVAALGRQLEDPDAGCRARALAVRAAVLATGARAGAPEITAGVVVGQVRSTAIDLLRGSGLDAEAARAALDEGVARAGSSPRA
jgi:predicted TIM-barrel enzyme